MAQQTKLCINPMQREQMGKSEQVLELAKDTWLQGLEYHLTPIISRVKLEEAPQPHLKSVT